ncbi:MAG: transglycosylase SLT domain-containing protein [Nitrosomonas sp.]|nr:transglycosylase SLT domain-containing protein [Nitrosomonas sp.]
MKNDNHNPVKLIAWAMRVFVLLIIPVTAAMAETLTGNHKNIIAREVSRVESSGLQDDLWVRMRARFSLGNPQGLEITRHEKNFSKQRFINQITDRSRRYLFYILEEVERRGIPAEIALVPIIESAFDPDAYSHKHAAGLWQFIPSTGKAFGLEQNWWHDERRDIVAATDAALDYLQMLYRMFGNWQLALAAYNWGQGALQKVIDEDHGGEKSVSFATIRMPAETRHYVAKLLAIRNIIANPGRYGVKLASIPNRSYFEQIELTEQIDVPLAARLAGISEKEFNALNPAYNRPVIRISQSPRQLLLPVASVMNFIKNMESYDKELVSWRIHEVRKMETLRQLAQRYRINVSKLARINGMHVQATLKNGQLLLVPRDGRSTRERAYLAYDPGGTFSDTENKKLIHVVKKGDTLHGIAKRYGINVKAIMSWNNGSTHLSVGQRLILKLNLPGSPLYSS